MNRAETRKERAAEVFVIALVIVRNYIALRMLDKAHFVKKLE